MHEEIWKRGESVWVVNSLLITGSLIVASQSNLGPLAYKVSLFLILVAFLMQISSEKMTGISYTRIEQIRKDLVMHGPTKWYRSEIKGKWWHIARRNLTYVLFLGLAVAYLYLLTGRVGLPFLLVAFSAFMIFVREVRDYVKREERKS